MNEQIIRSILRLYALLAGSDGVSPEERQRIAYFLNYHLPGRAVHIFLEYLEKAIVKASQHVQDKEWQQSELSSIVRTVNKELKLAKKLYLLLELVELSFLDGQVTSSEREILDFLQDALNISPEDFDKILKLGTCTQTQELDQAQFLIIRGESLQVLQKALLLQHPRFKGELAVWKPESAEIYFVRYFGQVEAYLNNQVMLDGMCKIWAPGATFRQENTDPIYFTDVRERFSQPEDKVAIRFDARNVEYFFASGKRGLHPINVSEKGGRMIAVMGASGCGKSTLFNVFNGNEKPTKGSVKVNGLNIHKNPDELQGVIGYIPQDELLNEHLTVFQNLYFAARFSFGNWQEEEIVAAVDRTLSSLGLSEIRNLEVGSPSNKTISGGQRKRLNIGMELIRQPSILFVDEPTSGLSSKDSVKTMELLKDLALNGKLVFVIIHQPSAQIFKMFDRLMVLDQGGYMIYYGNTLEAIPYFRKAASLPEQTDEAELANADEIFEIVERRLVNEMGEELEERRKQPAEWFAYYTKNKKKEEESKEKLPKGGLPNLINKPGFFKQIGLYFQRDFLAKIRDTQYLAINLLEAPFLALLLAIMVRYKPLQGFQEQSYRFFFNENIPAYFFMSVIVALFMGLSVSAEEIIRDRLHLKREKFLHLSRTSYLLAKILLLFLLSALHTLAFVAISDYVLEVNDIGFEFWLALFSTSCCANMAGLVLSDTFKNAVVVYILIPLLLIPQLVLGGVVVPFDKLNPVFGNVAKVPVVGESMVSKWAYEAIMVAQFKNNEYQKWVFDLEKKQADYHYKRTYYLPELRALASEIHFFTVDHPDKGSISKKQNLLFQELSKEGSSFSISTEEWQCLKKMPLSDKDYNHISGRIQQFLDYYNKAYAEAEKKLERHKQEFIQIPTYAGGSLSTLKQLSENEQVNKVVTNGGFITKNIEVTPDGIIRRYSPVHHYPEPTHFLDFRTHFYAPVKHFAGQYFKTEWFNIAVIWMFTLVTALILKTRALRRLLALLSGWWLALVQPAQNADS